MLYKGSNTYRMNSCETIEMFYNIRIDLDKLNYASYITKIILDVTEENQNSYKILQLFLNTLYTISETEKNIDLVISVFKIRLICILGYTPNINQCVGCGRKDELIYFSFKDNGFKCGVCAKQDTGVFQMSTVTMDAIKYIILAPAKKIFSFNIPEYAIKELEIISRIYFNDKLEKDYKM